MRHCRSGFTLIEVLIVVVIMAVLAATIIPQFSSSTSDAKRSALDFNTHSLRAQIELYKIDHNGAVPPLNATTHELEGLTQAAGGFGPYIIGDFPKNPFAGDASQGDWVVEGTGAGAVGTTAGWQYNSTTGEFWPNNPEYWAE
ncbi:MAG: type II secretion system protein [Pirellulales bacterium]|nr:type II secretion system protein [Pirellulales bacterium]